jgi:trimeric autotransporter adhesin
MPGSVIVPQGASTITWTIVTNPVAVSTPVQIKASANGGSSQATLTVNPNSPSQVTFMPSSVIGGASSVGKVSFARALLSDTVVTLNIVSGNSAIASMPSSITVPAGSTSGTWTVVTAPVAATTAVQISATANGGSITGTLTVKVGGPSNLIFNPMSVTGGATASGIINFSQPVAVDTDVQIGLLSGSAAIGSYSAVVTIPAGSTSAPFNVLTNIVGQTTTAQFSATANGGTTAGNLTVN